MTNKRNSLKYTPYGINILFFTPFLKKLKMVKNLIMLSLIHTVYKRRTVCYPLNLLVHFIITFISKSSGLVTDKYFSFASFQNIGFV